MIKPWQLILKMKKVSMRVLLHPQEYFFLMDIAPQKKQVTVATVQKESQSAEFWENWSTNPVPSDQAEELLKAISREASSHEFKKGYVMINAKKAGEVIAEDDENDKAAAAAKASKKETNDDESSVMKEIVFRSSKPTVFKPVDWSKCLK